MKLTQFCCPRDAGWSPVTPGAAVGAPDLVLVFAGEEGLRRADALADLRQRYPAAIVFGCSTAGEICDTRVLDDSLVATAVEFAHTRVELTSVPIPRSEESRSVGERLARTFSPDGLVHVLVLSDGIHVNGSELVKGLTAGLPSNVTVTGGLSGDGTRFAQTYVLAGGEPRQNVVAALGFYGDRLRVGYASLGGWDPFGPDRLVTRSSQNVLYELDGKSALALYKQYLGEHASGLPSTGLLFPLNVRVPGGNTPVVRTILAVDEDGQSMTFAGDVPEGSHAQLMRANFDRLIDGAGGAAVTSSGALGDHPAELAILISCVGRKLVLKQRIEEEVESVRDVMGTGTILTGFYSYGEISPFTPSGKCELHNQTMTITSLCEI